MVSYVYKHDGNASRLRTWVNIGGGDAFMDKSPPALAGGLSSTTPVYLMDRFNNGYYYNCEFCDIG